MAYRDSTAERTTITRNIGDIEEKQEMFMNQSLFFLKELIK